MDAVKKNKPKYNMWQNVAYMVSTAWRIKEKKVLVLCFLSAVFAVAKSLAELFVTPTVLACVENGDSVAKLLSAVGIFTLLTVIFSAAAAYIDENTTFGRIQTRMVNFPNKRKMYAYQACYKSLSVLHCPWSQPVAGACKYHKK